MKNILCLSKIMLCLKLIGNFIYNNFDRINTFDILDYKNIQKIIIYFGFVFIKIRLFLIMFNYIHPISL